MMAARLFLSFFAVLLSVLQVTSQTSSKTCTLRPLGKGKDDTDQVIEPMAYVDHISLEFLH